MASRGDQIGIERGEGDIDGKAEVTSGKYRDEIRPNIVLSFSARARRDAISLPIDLSSASV